MRDYPDIQGAFLKEGYRISRVGVMGLKRPVRIQRPDREVNLVPVFNISVNLPADQKGSHMSRHIEVINRALDLAVGIKNDSLEKLVGRIAKELLRSHDYATYADVELETDYFMERESPDGRRVTENYRLLAEAKIERGDDKPTRTIGVEVAGMSACPCAMETVRSMLKDELLQEGYEPSEVAILDQVPAPTHNQRNITTLKLEFNDDIDIEANELIELVEGALSSPSYEMLKRKGEGKVVLDAHRNPRFVEDIIREIIGRFLERYTDLPGDMILHVRSLSEESIHKHDAFAERISTLSELRG